MKQALVVWGGWEGHEPQSVAALLSDQLAEIGFSVEMSDTLKSFESESLATFDLIVPVWTMGEISPQQCRNVCSAVESGTGLAGCHGGMCDAFRNATEWQFLTGGQWVAHPGDDKVEYVVSIVRETGHPAVEGIDDFAVKSEQYYLHVDPANTVLATCTFPSPSAGSEANRLVSPCTMPQAWARMYGSGRVFYFAVGHDRACLEAETPLRLMRQGMAWASR